MPPLAPDLSVPEPLLESALLRAWHQLAPGQATPSSVQPLRRRPKSALYRLPRAGPGGANVIAKRCPRTTGAIERLIYQEILP
ncbi:MAG: hypothetical protein KGS61_11650, partial [Verrucomicrobia bacterium]|nr:hypothetical protein [Verrucomicrobiota bacterium]